MAARDLLLSCRKGDLERIRYLVEQKETEINIRDKWDSTPLYYACLCGHIDVVQYLLENGARCEANTFDGERCLYGALSSEIRNLLKNYKVLSSQTNRRELYHEFLRKLLDTGEFSDVCFVVHGEQFLAHKSILSARSEYFDEALTNGKWMDKNVIHVTHELVNPDAFRAVLCYLYTGQLETQVNQVDDVMRLARQLRLKTLEERLDEMASKAHFFQSTKPGTHVTTVLVESPGVFLRLDLSVLAEEAVPVPMRHWLAGPELLGIEPRQLFGDVVFIVQDNQFLCHKAFFCSRSDYFRTLLRDPLGELEQSGSGEFEALPVIPLRQFGNDVFLHILDYIYTDSVELSVSIVYDVLIAADLCLLPGLKRQCGAFISQFLEPANVIGAIRTARMFDLPRLEDQCCQFIAEHLHVMLCQPELEELIIEDASQVNCREDVDSIDIIDNVRYHLTANSFDEAQDKLDMIDELLDKLELDA